MTFIILKFAVTIITIYYRLILIEAEHQNGQSLRILSRQERAPGEVIKLRQFIHAVTYFWPGCSWPCTIPRDLNSAIDFGCFNRAADDSQRTCPSKFWILNWEKDDLGYAENRTQCPPAPASLGTFKCFTCICINRYFDGTDEADTIGTFSLVKQESDFKDNKVVTGLRYILDNKIVHLQIEQATFLKSGRVASDNSWKKVTDFVELSESSSGWINFDALEYGKDYLKFEPFTRTFYLDDVYVPNDYVVTGAKFTEIGATAEHNGIKLEIKGTKFDEFYRLIKGTDKWFDFSTSASNRVTYSSSRLEVKLSNCDASEMSILNEPLRYPNYYVRFRATKDYANQDARPAIPYFSGDPAKTGNDLPLKGLGLSYKGREGYGGYVTVRVFSHPSLFPTVIKPINAIKTKNPAKAEPKIDAKVYRLRTHSGNISCSGNQNIDPSQAESEESEDVFLIPSYREGNSGATIGCQLFFNIILLLVLIFL